MMSASRVKPKFIPLAFGPLLAALALAVGLPSAADATMRKCTASVGGPLLMVNGVILGDLPDSGDWWYPTPAGPRKITSKEIIEQKMICIEQEEAGKRVSRTVISVATGDEGMLRKHLTDLAELQDGYRQKYGSYASMLPFLEFYRTRPPVPIELTTVDGGWSASTAWAGRSCRIAVGAAVPAGGISGEVECFAAIDGGKPAVGDETAATRRLLIGP